MEPEFHFEIPSGSGQNLPIDVRTLQFAAARVQELYSIDKALDSGKKHALLFQRLPRHMRRRVMSHNPKRLPRNLREGHANQMVKSWTGPVAQQKKPSRKHRRRPSNLLEEYNRRQRSFVWLETHIWHAKRFHMIERWGYRLAHFPIDRSYRACYRAAANHCLMQDVSFLGCIELTGPLNILIAGLSKHTSSNLGLTFAAQSLLDGSREGEVMFYEGDEYPYHSIGSVSFQWKPENISSSGVRSLWIWAHPAFYCQIVTALLITFQLSRVCDKASLEHTEGENKPSNDASTSKKKRKRENGEVLKIEELKLSTRNVPSDRTPKYRSLCGTVEMMLLKDTLNRFRLTGPLSQEVLMEALQLATTDFHGIVSSSLSTSSNTTSVLSKDKYHSDVSDASSQNSARNLTDVNCQGRESHSNFWLAVRKALTPAELPPRMILSLIVKDPRLCIPDKRTKAYPNRNEARTYIPSLCPPLPYSSPLWVAKMRDEATKNKLSTNEFNVCRSKLLVPGMVKANEEDGISEVPTPGSALDTLVDVKIPVMLVQRPGSQDPLTKRLGFGCGWDVIFPAGWAMPFWLAFNFRCARASGLREASAHELERGLCEFLPPDSRAGLEEESRNGKEEKEKHFRLPPDKRPNFIKLGVACPFQAEWSKLVRDWMILPCDLNDSKPKQECVQSINSGPSSFFVLRDFSILRELNKFLSQTWLILHKSNETTQRSFEAMVPELPTFPWHEKCLLAVHLEALHKGVTDDMSLICIPLPEDVVNIVGNPLENVPVEPSHPDKNHDTRLTLRKDQKKLLLRLRRHRIRAKKKEEQGSVESGNHNRATKKMGQPSPTKDLVDSFNKKMEELWLHDTNDVGSIRNSGSRETAGFVTRGNFSFTEAKGCGVGYITFFALQKLVQLWLTHFPKQGSSRLQSDGFVVLVRSPKSFQYRLAKLSLIFDKK